MKSIVNWQSTKIYIIQQQSPERPIVNSRFLSISTSSALVHKST